MRVLEEITQVLGYSCGNDPSLGPGVLFCFVVCWVFFLFKAFCCLVAPRGLGWSLLATARPHPPWSIAVKTPTSFTLLVYLSFYDGTVITFLVVVT